MTDVTSEELAAARRALGMSRAMVGKETGLKVSVIFQIEHGFQPSPRALELLTAALQRAEAKTQMIQRLRSSSIFAPTAIANAS